LGHERLVYIIPVPMNSMRENGKTLVMFQNWGWRPAMREP